MQIADMPMVRVFFEKGGRAKYTSHLDVMRALTRAFRRSGLPFWYTEGYNPHLYMTFALPVALGVESACESVDLRLTEAVGFDVVVSRLREVLPPGYAVVSAAPPVLDPGCIAWADYEMRLSDKALSGEELAAKLREFLALPAIETVKKTKKGPATIDLQPYAKALSLTVSGEGASLRFRLRLAAGNTLNISPTLFLNAFRDWGGEQLGGVHAGVRRTAILTGEQKDFA